MITNKFGSALSRRMRGGAMMAVLVAPITALASGTIPVPSDIASKPAEAAMVGRTASDQQIHLSIILPSRNPAGAAAFVARVSKPGDPLFRHFLTPQQYAERFGGKLEDYRAIVVWAKSQGLTVGQEFTGHHVIAISGSAAAIEAAFSLHLNDYKDSTGRVFYNADAAPVLPSSISGRVSAVLGLSSLVHHVPLVKRAPAGLHPAFGGTGPGGAFSASDLRTAYTIPTQSLPKTETVALFEQGGFDPKDVKTYLAANHLASVPVKAIGVDGYGRGIDDLDVELEAVLDIDMVIGINPSVKEVLVYEDGDDPFGVALIDSFAAMASDGTAQTISISYGTDERLQTAATMQSENTVLTQLAAQGQSVFVSAGDNGAYGRTGLGRNVEDPGSQPLVTSVGGTTLFTDNNQNYAAEMAWDEFGVGGGATGGGVSKVWTIPDYQVKNGTSVAVANGGSATYRNVPDVAAVADPFTGVSVYSYLNGGWVMIGGTSASAPMWAGFMSIANHASKAVGFSQIGFANPNLYKFADYGVFTDVVDGENGDKSLFGKAGFLAGIGYDNTTGLGSFGPFLENEMALWPVDPYGEGPAAPRGLAGKANSTTIHASWTAVTGVNGYIVEIYSLVTSKIVFSEITAGTNVIAKGLPPNTPCVVDVFSFDPSGAGQYSQIELTTR